MNTNDQLTAPTDTSGPVTATSGAADFPMVTGPVQPPARRLATVFGPTVRKGALALFDQALVSGTRFFTTIMVGRMCGADELGIYSLGFTFVALIHGVQEALISVPYTVYGNRLHGQRRAEYAGGILVHNGMLTLIAMVLLATFAWLLSVGIGPQQLQAVSWILVALIPLTLLREFGRRFAFAHLQMTTAVALDLLVAIIQICGLIWLAGNGGLTAGTAYLVTGLGCSVALVWLVRARRNFIVRRRLVVPQWRRHWSFGRWVFAGQVTTQITWYMMYWLVALALGTKATGVFAACMTIVFFSNPFILGINNLLAPKTALAYAQGGRVKVRQFAGKAMLFMGGAMAIFCVAIALVGDQTMQLLYEGSEFAGQGHTLFVLALGVTALAACLAADTGLWAIERPEVNFIASLLGLLVTAVVASVLVMHWGMVGAAYGLLAGSVVESGFRITAFLILVSKSHAGQL